MKLYATIASERAMKGQGGKYLDITIKNEYQEIMWVIRVESFTEPRAMLELFSSPDKTIRQYYDYKTKDKKQKDEKRICGHCGCRLGEHDDLIKLPHYH